MKRNKNNIIESYRRFRNIIQDYSKSNIKCISVTSNSDKEGKTIVAKNLAVMLAKSGNKLLFIDCNLSNNLKEKGLIDILQEMGTLHISDIELKNYINDTQCENLSDLRLGTNNLDDYDSIFKTENLKSIIECLKKSYDYIIIDAPSFEKLSYTQILAGATDGCLFVMKEGVNEVSKADLIKDKLAKIGCKVLGCVLNKEKKPTEIFEGKYSNFFNVQYKGRKNRVSVRKDTAKA